MEKEEQKKLSKEEIFKIVKNSFGIAQLLLNNPKLIIVDEPTAGGKILSSRLVFQEGQIGI